MCYRYTIPQELLNEISILDGYPGNRSWPDSANPVDAGALLLATSRPWQARGDGVVAGGRGKSRGHLCGGMRRGQGGADEPLFRRTGFPPDADGRAQPAAPQAADVRCRCLRDQARRRVPDVEPVHRRPRSNWRGSGWRRSVDADLDVVVGGLGLGYTARAVLENAGVRSLIVVDALAEVIEWHEQGLLPLGKELTGDPRCRLVNGDFFAMSHSAEGFDHRSQGRRFDAVLVDIDHSPRKSAASAPRRAVRAGRARPACRRICIPAAFSRCGRTIRRMMRSSACWPARLQPRHRHVVTFDNLARRPRCKQYRLCRRSRRTCHPGGNRRWPAPRPIERLAAAATANLPLPTGHAMLALPIKRKRRAAMPVRIQGHKSLARVGPFGDVQHEI